MKRITDKKRKWIERTIANDRSYKLYLYNRLAIFTLLVIVQAIVFIGLGYLFVYASTIGVALQIALFVLQLVTVLYLINKTDRPATKLNWILLILLVPVVGVPSYLLYGEGKPTRKMNEKITLAKAENRHKMGDVYRKSRLDTPKKPRSRGETIEEYLENYAGYPSYKNGGVTYYESGEKMFPDMLDALRAAEKYIFIEYFIIAHGKMWGEILDILLQKAEQGVKIRVIYDDFGCIVTLPPHYDKYLESLHENIRCMAFNNIIPLFDVRMNNRDHRKMLVVDGKVAFTGGINLADEYIGEKIRFGYWKDTGLKITGGAVRTFVDMFTYMWNAFRKDKEDVNAYLPSLYEEIQAEKSAPTGATIQPYDDSPLDERSVGAAVYADLISRASRYVYIFTPYLILDDFLRSLLIQAALRGVDVRIVTPGIPDKKMTYRITRANYAPLMKAGVKIYEYTPGFIHAKSMLCDGESAVVGTINLDYRSLYLHFENAVYFTEPEAVGALERDCEATFAVSKLCTPENTKRSVFGKFIDALLRVFETLF